MSPYKWNHVLKALPDEFTAAFVGSVWWSDGKTVWLAEPDAYDERSGLFWKYVNLPEAPKKSAPRYELRSLPQAGLV